MQRAKENSLSLIFFFAFTRGRENGEGRGKEKRIQDAADVVLQVVDKWHIDDDLLPGPNGTRSAVEEVVCIKFNYGIIPPLN